MEYTMKKDNGLRRLVYDYYETRIRFGFYQYGDCLPSIPQICENFHLGRTTVRAALELLEKGNYIRTAERKAASVIFVAGSCQFRENAARYYLPRKEGILDLSEAGKLLFVPLWECALRQWSRERWECILHDLSNIAPGAVPLTVKFYMGVLSSWNNQLILNLVWEVIRYLRFPYLSNRDEPRITAGELMEVLQGDGISFLKVQFQDIYGRMIDELLDFIGQSAEEFHLESLEKVPFRWNIYRRRPQMRYTLVSVIIREILTGIYPVGSYLPSLPQMENKYKVSLTTVRRTLSILEALGVTRSFQGKGTQVFMAPVEIDFTLPDIREGLRLYRESVQLLALTAGGITQYTLEYVQEGKRKELGDRLMMIQEQKKSYNCFEVILTFIKEECPLAAVRECYGQMAELITWGYPFMLLRLQDKSLDQRYQECVRQQIKLIREGDYAAFSAGWGVLLENEEHQCTAFMKAVSGNIDKE